MITDEEIDKALLQNINHRWRKVAYVVGMTMMQIDKDRRQEKIDLYFAKRVVGLVEKGLIEYEGDLKEMRFCEVRFPQSKENTE